MNIHFYKSAGGAFKAAPTARGHKASKDGTAAPRTRPGQTYPGGKALRRVLAKLAARRSSRDDIISEFSRTRPTIAGTLKNVPGSMQA